MKTLQDQFIECMQDEADLFKFDSADELVFHTAHKPGIAFSESELDEVDCEHVTQLAESMLLLKALS